MFGTLIVVSFVREIANCILCAIKIFAEHDRTIIK